MLGSNVVDTFFEQVGIHETILLVVVEMNGINHVWVFGGKLKSAELSEDSGSIFVVGGLPFEAYVLVLDIIGFESERFGS